MHRRNRHHMMFESRSFKTPLRKSVRRMGAFVLEAPLPNHNLLHFSLSPPEVPNPDTLHSMQRLAKHGLEAVIQRLDDPIVEHLANQLEIIKMDTDTALQMLEARVKWVA